MRFNCVSVLALGLITPVFAYPRPEVERRGSPNVERAFAVRNAFNTSWIAYYHKAFPHDTLHPASNTYVDDRNGWGVTAIDALSTAIIMGHSKAVDQILRFVPKIKFTTTAKYNQGVSVFETNIRYLGGLLSAYDLLKGPMDFMVKDPQLVANLLTQAESLANSLKVAFDTPSGVPDPTVFLNPKPRNSGTDRNNIAEIGTLVLEWTRLSDLTGNKLYAELAQKAEEHLLKPEGSPEAWPGLVGTFVSTKNGQFLDSNGGWSGLTDSFYEYLIKMYVYDREAFKSYKDRWVLAADSTMKYLASHPTSQSNLTFLSQYSGQQPIPQSGHLASFAGGNFILGGIVLREEKYIKFGVELAESYYETYRQTASGIGPEGFQWVSSEIPQNSSANPPPPPAQSDVYKKTGFWPTSPGYILRPETIESLYYAYRVTGDPKFQDLAWEAFQHIRKACRVGIAFSSINDVTKPNGGGISDEMQSFWLAETLKYLYLIFGEESEVQLKLDEPIQFVFNTEAHPLKVRGS